MVSEKMYRYLGRNGTITSPIQLEDLSPIAMRRLKAESGKVLTNGRKRVKEVIVFEDEISEWVEINEAEE